MSAYKWIVVINREGVSDVTGFHSRIDAQEFFDTWSAQWSESYLCEVVIGPKV